MVVNTTLPLAGLFPGPIQTMDKMLCNSLDIVEKKVPLIHMPTEQIYSNTKQYIDEVGQTFIRPILKRADSVKQMGQTVLDNKYALLAADKLDGALNVADKYVDKFLPADQKDKETEENDASNAVQDNNLQITYKTIHHMDRFSRKLQRRLTRRTIAEAKALKEHSTEAINVLVYAVEVIASDPKLAHQKIHDLWEHLSHDEPENQKPPQDLEELLVMITRESARRFVHFINFARSVINALPGQIMMLTHKCVDTVNNIQKENLNQIISKEASSHAYKITLLLYQLSLYTATILEHMVKSFEEKEQNYKTPSTKLQFSTVRVKTNTPSTVNIKVSKYNNVVNGADNAHK